MICHCILVRRCLWGVIMGLFIHDREVNSIDSQCQSFRSLKEKTNELRNSNVNLYCDVSSTCTDIDCLARNGVLYSHIKFGFSFETFCSLTATFTFYWSVGDRNATRNLYNINITNSEIDIKYWNPEPPSQDDRRNRIKIEISLTETGKDYIVLFIQVSLKMNSSLTIDLIPPHNLTFDLCSDAQYTIDVDLKQYTTPVMPEETIIRTLTNRACEPNEMGNCRDNEVCRRTRNINNETKFFCYCLDGFVFDSKQVCVLQRTNKSSNYYNVIAGTMGGLVMTVIIIIVFIIIIKKYQRRSRRYNEFDLITHDPTLPDPPMLEA